MSLRFSVLASGSAGNACLVQTHGYALLVDLGLQPRALDERLRAAGSSLAHIRAVLLTHTHGDHWNDAALSWLADQQVDFYCHPSHHPALGRKSSALEQLRQTGHLHSYDPGQEFHPGGAIRCRPLAVRHDSGQAFGFRLEGPPDLFGRTAAVGYASDLGSWDSSVADALADVDLLAIEFNHDEQLQRRSGRPDFLIARVLGDEGHLSNDQAARLVGAVLARTQPGRLRHLVQLHLSSDCNRPLLARQAVKEIVAGQPQPVRIHTAEQDRASKILRLEPGFGPPLAVERASDS